MDNNQSSEIVKSSIINNNSTYCSFRPKTNEERKALFNASEKCDVVLNDIVGQEIEIANILINEYPRKDKETGEELSNGHRTIIFDKDNKTYVTASNYFFIALSKLVSTFGEPSEWAEPIKIKIVKKDVKDGKKALGFELV